MRLAANSADDPRLGASPGLTRADLDLALALQIAVAWAGETGRLGWCRSELTSEWDGEDLFAR